WQYFLQDEGPLKPYTVFDLSLDASRRPARLDLKSQTSASVVLSVVRLRGGRLEALFAGSDRPRPVGCDPPRGRIPAHPPPHGMTPCHRNSLVATPHRPSPTATWLSASAGAMCASSACPRRRSAGRSARGCRRAGRGRWCSLATSPWR